ncbi:MAG: RNA methyltransferase [Acidobacteria bacterium]|nr:RNA methyltransferase [Acidobacteriota bacterium]
MAGTDHRRSGDHLAGNGPAIILVEPQLGENIGTTARAMYNCGLTDLRLVRPRDGWPNPMATKAASGADPVLEAARLFDSTAEAAADLQRIYATTARPRDMVKPVLTPRLAAQEMYRLAARGEAFGVLFGPERTGLSNDDVVLAESILAVPLNPAFSSLNLAQAVLLIGYEWYQGLAQATEERELPQAGSRPATSEELMHFFRHLEDDLIDAGFLLPVEKRPIMIRNLRNVFQRARLTDQELRTLHGVVRSLSGRRNRRRTELSKV